MNLQYRTDIAWAYKASSQIARVLSEEWCARELYCAACDSNRLSPRRANAPTCDFDCPACKQSFQLKSFKTWNQRKIVDAGYHSMIRAIRADMAPNLLVLNYSADWQVRNLMLIPKVFLSESAIEKRGPLGPAAQRAGWVGCNILLDRIPEDGKIALVRNGSALVESDVRREFSRVRRLAEVPPTLRGWTLDVLNVIRKLGRATFAIQELYKHEPELRAMHPNNQNVRPKIRQQLQVLRNLGLIEFGSPGNYTLKG